MKGEKAECLNSGKEYVKGEDKERILGLGRKKYIKETESKCQEETERHEKFVSGADRQNFHPIIYWQKQRQHTQREKVFSIRTERITNTKKPRRKTFTRSGTRIKTKT